MNSLKIINRCHESTSKGWKAILNNDEIEEIKKDLEVLEILKKYLYSKSYIVETYQGVREEKTIEMKIDENGKLVDYRKIFKWLEGNENEKKN